MDLDSLTKEYSGDLTGVATSRLRRERAAFERDELSGHGIFVKFEEDCFHKAVALIVGPKGTPYAMGLYLFEVTFPNSYPLRPPRVIFKTGDGRVRFNPNLYVDGKVCLSVLGTWHGPSWTPLCTLRSTLLSIQSLLCAEPLQNEPGFERNEGRDSQLYAAIIRYENVAVTVLQQLSRPLSKSMMPLRGIMVEHFLKHFTEFLRAVDEFEGCDGKCDSCPVYAFITCYRPTGLKKDLMDLKSDLLDEVSCPAAGCTWNPAAEPLHQGVDRTSASSSITALGQPHQGCAADRPFLGLEHCGPACAQECLEAGKERVSSEGLAAALLPGEEPTPTSSAPIAHVPQGRRFFCRWQHVAVLVALTLGVISVVHR